MITGRCLCGTVRFDIAGSLGPVVCCHCSQCRHASGSAFAANASVSFKHVRFTSGKDAITEFESSPGKFRGFCSGCGSQIYSRREVLPQILRVRLGTVEGDPGQRLRAHIFVGSKAPWFEITDDLPQYEAEPPPEYEVPGSE